MDTLTQYRTIIAQVLTHYVEVPYAYGAIQNETIFDPRQDRYVVLSVGWQGQRRVHGCLIHIDIIAGKVWVQADGTEDGVARTLEAAGVAKQDIVLGFQRDEVRSQTAYAVA